MQVGDNIRKLREGNSMKVSHLANLLNISVQALYQYETNKRMPDYEKLMQIATCFDVSTDYLLGLKHFDYGSKIDLFLDQEKSLISSFRALADDDRAHFLKLIQAYQYLNKK